MHAAGPDTRPARGPSLAVDASGTLHLAWAVGETPSADVRYAHSQESGLAWTEPQVVGESDGHSDAPSLATSGDGTVHLAYGESPPGSFRQYHIR